MDFALKVLPLKDPNTNQSCSQEGTVTLFIVICEQCQVAPPTNSFFCFLVEIQFPPKSL